MTKSKQEEVKIISPADQKNQLAIEVKNQDYTAVLANLSPKQKEHYLAIADSVQLQDINTISKYGEKLNNIIASNGESLLAQRRNNTGNEIVELTDDLYMQIKDIAIAENQSKKSTWLSMAKHLPIVRKLVNTVERAAVRTETAIAKVDKIETKMHDAKGIALRSNDELQSIFNNSLKYIQQIKEYIIGGKLKLEEMEAKLKDMNENPQDYEQYEIAELQNFITLFQKRVTDMQTTEYTLSQNLLQIKAAQNNNLEIASKSDNIVNNVIPIWKSQLALSMIMGDQKKSVDAQVKIQKTTQDILKKNAEALKINTVEMARQSESSIIEIETIQDTTQKLVECMNEVQQIRIEGERSRKNIEEQLKQCSEALWKNIQNSTW